MFVFEKYIYKIYFTQSFNFKSNYKNYLLNVNFKNFIINILIFIILFCKNYYIEFFVEL